MKLAPSPKLTNVQASRMDADSVGLGNRALLDKVDKLRELGISSQIPLPQIVAAGEQSAGKSSLLESLTGISFPRSVSLCTRFATEIICRREKEISIVVTIQPASGSSDDHAKSVREFRRTVSSFTGEEFADVFKEATKVMGIKTDPTSDSSAPTFTRDVLRIEKNGPSEEHLTLIDVPGIFENESPGLTTKHDIELVKNLVKEYIKDTRTIILAVAPCNTDIATQTIIRFAAEVDPKGKRTLGVLTKPDLAVETATKNAAAELVRGRRNDNLGYCVVRNRGADDHSVTIDMDARNAEESAFFSQEPWSKLDKSRLGIPALRARLRELLMDRTKSEFPSVKREVAATLKEAKEQLQALGDSRAETDEQRAYLGHIAIRFADLVKFGLDAYYNGDEVFLKSKNLRLITRMRDLNDAFAETFYWMGHQIEFESDTKPTLSDQEDEEDGSVSVRREDLYDSPLSIPIELEEDLDGILIEPFDCPDPQNGSLLNRIQVMYKENRGYELGTFGSSMIPAAFRLQATKWEKMALAHVSNAILVVHHFINAMIAEACPDETVRYALWQAILEELGKRYQRAMDHVRFLLDVELNGKSVTCVPNFETALSSAEGKRMMDRLKPHAVEICEQTQKFSGISKGEYVRIEDVAELNGETRQNEVDPVCEKIHDVTKAYYEVARARFVDGICVYAVDHFLLSSKDSPLRVFGPDYVLSMTAEQLEMIAAEDAATRSTRLRLKERIKLLEQAVKILRA
ncbi:putative dynamin family protein [Echria macrotheca]|uniref:Dynamin family protein n=1 Tax=Echria macrotheca TaxID=438768 RepID=A0AAJ0BF94_9PEZI|nr:putative dynamin family protein [Echria macrotheca]